MSRAATRRATGLLAALLALAPAAALADPAPLRLTIAFTGDVGGYLEPCG